MLLENMIDQANRAYRSRGRAHINNTNQPITIQRRRGSIVTGRLEGKGAVDYWGVIRGGRAVCFDAKEVNSTNLPVRRFNGHQLADMRACEEMGGIAGAVVMWGGTRIYWVPYQLLADAAARAENGGRKSISAAEVRECPEILPESIACRCDWLPVVVRIEQRMQMEANQQKLFG
jgi:recombination protein U